jgi:hypothetical protein
MKKLFLCFLLFRCAGCILAQSPEAVFVEVSGRVETQEAGSPGWETAAPGNRIGRNTVIATGLKSSAVISLGSSRLEVRPLTMLTLQELVRRGGAEETTLYLRTGRIRAEVAPPAGENTDFTVGSPVATASVRGTSFEFDGRHLRVDTGRVLLEESNGQKVYVAGKQRSYVDESDQNRIVPPFEAATLSLRPVIPQLNNIGRNAEGLIGFFFAPVNMYWGWPLRTDSTPVLTGWPQGTDSTHIHIGWPPRPQP